METLSRAAFAALIVVCLVQTVPAQAEVLDLQDAVTRALARDAQFQALEARARAAGARSIADGALPDPELSLGYLNAPVDDLTGADMMSMSMVSLRQQFPPGSTRNLRRSRGELEAELLRTQRDEHALGIRSNVRRAWLDWRLATEAEALVGVAEARMSELLSVTERRLATAAAGRQDVARVRLENATLADRRLVWASQRESAAAELARWLGEGVGSPGRGPAWTAPERGPLAAKLDDHPALRRAGIREELGEVGRDLALEAYKPMWMLEVGYGFRRGREPVTGESRSDTVSGMVSVSVPLFTAKRQDQRLRAATGEREAARFEQTDLRRELLGRLDRQWSLWQRHVERLVLYEETLLPAAADTRSAMLDAYRNGRAIFDEVIRAELDELDRRLGALLTARQRDDARIELLFLGGE